MEPLNASVIAWSMIKKHALVDLDKLLHAQVLVPLAQSKCPGEW